MGDFGGSPDFPYYTKVETGVAKSMGSIGDKYQTSFTLALGDNFYDDGVKNVKDRRFEVLNMDDSFISPFILKILRYVHLDDKRILKSTRNPYTISTLSQCLAFS